MQVRCYNRADFIFFNPLRVAQVVRAKYAHLLQALKSEMTSLYPGHRRLNAGLGNVPEP